MTNAHPDYSRGLALAQIYVRGGIVSRCCRDEAIIREMRRESSESRLRVFKAGTIEFGRAGIDCTVRNIIDKGATLEVASPIGIPPEITLYVATSQLRRHGYIVWRKEKRIGVVFD